MKFNQFDVITFGSAMVDVFMRSADFSVVKEAALLPKEFAGQAAQCLPLGGKIEVQDMTLTTGGGATNNAVSFARKGFRTGAVFGTGNGMNADSIIHNLKHEGVDTFEQHFGDKYSGYSVILIAAEGGRTVLVHRGASALLNPVQIPWEQLQAKWYYISSLGGNMDAVRAIVDNASGSGIGIAWNPGSLELAAGAAKIADVLEKAAVLFVNEEEAASLAGIKMGETDRIFTCLQEISKGILLVMTRGSRGVMVSYEDRVYSAGIFPEKEKVDRTGAGDAFGSGFMSTLLEVSEWNESVIREAIRRGSANGTSVLEHIGAKEGLLTKEQLNDERWNIGALKINN